MHARIEAPATGRYVRTAALNAAARARSVADLLQGYAQRAVFRGFSSGPLVGQKQSFSILWHYNRIYPLVLDLAGGTLTFDALLPAVKRHDPLVAELKAFVRAFSARELPEHRRVDPSLGQLRVRARGGAISLEMAVRSQDYTYCARKLVHVTHEIFLVFLREGPYFDYRCQALGLDPDAWG